MSSSRSLASARTKRAAGNSTVPGNPDAPPEQSHPNVTQPPVTKLTLPQAFNLMGDRLNNLELFMETTTTVVDEIQEFHSNTSEKYIVDMNVFTSLVARMETLERTCSERSESDISATSSASSNVTNDIDELKTHLIRLQTYVMETNAKLQDMVLAGNGASMVSFGEVFSDSHPTPPTLMRSVTIGHNDDGHVSDSDGSVEENDSNASDMNPNVSSETA
jgi:hypothetical protein